MRWIGENTHTHADGHTLLPRPAKQRLQWSALLLFVLGLCSLASPHLMRHAHVHHTGSTGARVSYTGRGTARSGSRSSVRGGAQSELDRDRLHAELSAGRRNPASGHSAALAGVSAIALPAATLPRIALARSALPRRADPALPASPASRLSRGRAPPVA